MVARDDDDGPNAVLTYTLQDNKDERFEIDKVTGVVTSYGDFWPGNYTILTVSVQNCLILFVLFYTDVMQTAAKSDSHIDLCTSEACVPSFSKNDYKNVCISTGAVLLLCVFVDVMVTLKSVLSRPALLNSITRT